MRFIIAFALAIVGVLPAMAQRADIRNLDNVRYNLGTEMRRDHAPYFVVNSLLYDETNASHGLIIVRTNATVLVVVKLPNPTNNVEREFQIVTSGASTVRLTNNLGAPFHDCNNMTNSAVGLFVESNKTARAWSTGTNWTVVIR